MARCLVIGANGFLGSHLVDALVQKGHTVRAFDRFSRGVKFDENPRAEVVVGDFLNRHDIKEALRDIEYVFHFISTTTPITAEDDPLIDVDTNIRMSIELFDECARTGVKKVIFASTGGSIYGGDSKTPLSEEINPHPTSPYAIGKLTIEHYLRYYRVKHGLQSVALRISNPYGERQPLHRKQGVIPIFLEKVANGQPLTILGDGSMVRDYIYVKDVAAMVSEVFERPMKQEVYNLGSGQGVSVNELVAHIEKLTEKTIATEHKPAPPTFVQSVVLDTSRFAEEFGIKPNTTLEHGIGATWEYIKKHHEDNA